jgi:hypothetical protein
VKFKPLKLISILSLLANQNIYADDEMNCQKDFLCQLPVDQSFCEVGYTPSMTWDSLTDTYILNCNCNCTSQENNGWIIEKKSNSLAVHKTTASLIARKSSITEWNELIPGDFGPSPLCSTVKANSHDLVSLTKVPANGPNPTPPYCYIGEKLEINDEACISRQCKEIENFVAGKEKKFIKSIFSSYIKTQEQITSISSSISYIARRKFMEYYIGNYGYHSKDQQKYNDIAYFWQKSGNDKDAIWLLKIIISKNPERTVAYLNIADSLWRTSNKEESINNYKVYILKMKSQKNNHLIPPRALSRTTKSQ